MEDDGPASQQMRLERTLRWQRRGWWSGTGGLQRQSNWSWATGLPGRGCRIRNFSWAAAELDCGLRVRLTVTRTNRSGLEHSVARM